MRSSSCGAWPLLGAALLMIGPANALDLPVQQRRLDNGLTVIVHEDHRVPLVAANVIYRVGSKDEQPGRTGFAHLFEHLMFMGTRRAPTKAFDQWMEASGGSNNAWTSTDFTSYHEVGPVGLLPLFLWLEADRLQALGNEIDKAKLDLQRDVVRNERRQTSENTPYGKVELRLPEVLYPADHPYHHPVIGSHADLEAATVNDVRSFFAQHYTPSNAALVIAGDVATGDAMRLAERYFGLVPQGNPVDRDAPTRSQPKLGRVVRETLEDNVEMTRIVMAFPSPAHFEPGDAELDLLASILAAAKTGRLYRGLVYERPLAQSVHAAQQSASLASSLQIEITVRPGVDADLVEKTADTILADVVKSPPTDQEVQRAKNQISFDFADRLQSLDARAALFATYWAEKGDPDFARRDLGRYETATAAGIHAQAKATVNLAERVILRVVPATTPVTARSGAP
jgi:zinc protease